MNRPELVLGLLAAGEGSRLRNEGIAHSKGMVEVAGIPLIRRSIERFVAAGVERVYTIVNEEADDLHDYLATTDFGVPVAVHIESTPSSLHSLVALAPMLESAAPHFFLSMVDSICAPGELLRFVEQASSLAGERDGAIGITRFVEDEKPLYVDFDEKSGMITAVGENAVQRSHVTGGLYYFPRASLAVARNLVASGASRLRSFQSKLVVDRFRIHGIEFEKIIDVDHIDDIERAEAYVEEFNSVEVKDDE